MLSFSLVAEAPPDLPSPFRRKLQLSVQMCGSLYDIPLDVEKDSDVDFEASRRSTRVQSKSTIRSALFLAKH